MYKYSLIGFLALIIGCQSIEKNKKPETFLSEDEMVNALTELTILKATSTVAAGIKKDSGIDFKEYSLKNLGIDSTIISENIAYYGYKPELLKKIYLRVEDSLEQRYILHDSIYKLNDTQKDSDDLKDFEAEEEWRDD